MLSNCQLLKGHKCFCNLEGFVAVVVSPFLKIIILLESSNLCKLVEIY